MDGTVTRLQHTRGPNTTGKWPADEPPRQFAVLLSRSSLKLNSTLFAVAGSGNRLRVTTAVKGCQPPPDLEAASVVRWRADPYRRCSPYVTMVAVSVRPKKLLMHADYHRGRKLGMGEQVPINLPNPAIAIFSCMPPCTHKPNRDRDSSGSRLPVPRGGRGPTPAPAQFHESRHLVVAAL